MANPEFTVKQFAAREQVNERTVRRWVEKGALQVRRTPGGGLRIADKRADVQADNRGHSSR